jgi:hypothetical protein
MIGGRKTSRTGVLLALAAVCLLVSGCSGSRITKANADRINVGMTEQEVSAILGGPNETSEVALPDVGAMMGAVPGVSALPKKARQSVWKEGPKVITITFVDGRVSAKTAAGL